MYTPLVEPLDGAHVGMGFDVVWLLNNLFTDFKKKKRKKKRRKCLKAIVTDFIRKNGGMFEDDRNLKSSVQRTEMRKIIKIE